MYLGDTLEEKRESYILLKKQAKKLGIFFGIMGTVMALIMMGVIFGGALGEGQMTGKISLFLIACTVPFVYYYMGYLWYFGFLTVQGWFIKSGIGVSGAVGAVGHSMAVSYILGGRKTAKLTGIIWLIALVISLSIGFYVGLFHYIKIRSEAKRLGFL